LTGSFDDFVLAGRANIANGYLKHYDLPQSLNEINGPITMEKGRISVDGLTAMIGEGRVAFEGRFCSMAIGRIHST
jgi:hypothetical protein